MSGKFDRTTKDIQGLSPGKSRYRTFDVLGLHFSDYRVYQDLAIASGLPTIQLQWGNVDLNAP